jgi:hypothetical protein
VIIEEGGDEMSMTLEIPPPLEDELSREAKREELSPEDHATLLLCLATALRKSAQETPFRKAVKEFLSSHSVDADRFSSALEALLGICSKHRDETPTVPNESERQWALLTAPHHGGVLSILQSWRNDPVHMPPTEAMIESAGRSRRQPSAMGKYSHLGISSEEFAREKQEEIAREERGWE